jgi:hypothetical protein
VRHRLRWGCGRDTGSQSSPLSTFQGLEFGPANSSQDAAVCASHEPRMPHLTGTSRRRSGAGTIQCAVLVLMQLETVDTEEADFNGKLKIGGRRNWRPLAQGRVSGLLRPVNSLKQVRPGTYAHTLQYSARSEFFFLSFFLFPLPSPALPRQLSPHKSLTELAVCIMHRIFICAFHLCLLCRLFLLRS